MKNLLVFFPSNIVTAAGWALVHSLWQITALALIYVVFSKVFRRSHQKYWSGILLMTSQLAVSLITFTFYFKPLSSNLNQDLNSTISFTNEASTELSLVQKTQQLIETNLPFLFQIWVLGMSILMLRFCVNLWYVQHLKTSGLRPVSRSINDLFKQLITKTELKNVSIFESEKINLPMVIGFLKPVVLLPVGLATGLCSKQLEAILAHELAHIKRNDFFVNVLQSIVEIAFFFHPAIWWLSSEIRQEREHACDDFSVAITGDKILLVKALAEVESFRQSPNLAMAFGKKKFTLLDRIHRILEINATQTKSRESIFGVSFLAILLIVVFGLKQEKTQAQAKQKPIQSQQKSKDIIQYSTNTIETVKVKADTNEHSVLNYSNGQTKIRITDDSRIFVNGQERNLSPQEREKLKASVKKMKAAEIEMKPFSDMMQAYGSEMQGFGDQMKISSLPIEAAGGEMKNAGKEMEKIGKELDAAIRALVKTKPETKLHDELNAKVDEMSKKMDAIGKIMDQHGQQMNLAGKEMEKFSAPMDSIGKLMDAEGKKLDAVGKRLEQFSKELQEGLPADIRAEFDKPMNRRSFFGIEEEESKKSKKKKN